MKPGGDGDGDDEGDADAVEVEFTWEGRDVCLAYGTLMAVLAAGNAEGAVGRCKHDIRLTPRRRRLVSNSLTP